MSTQYGNPDWAEPSAPTAESSEGNNASAWTASSGGEDFSAAANANVNASGSGNHRQVELAFSTTWTNVRILKY